MRKLLILLAIALGLTGPIHAQYDDVPSFEDTLEVYEDLFNKDDPIVISMKFDVKTFKRTRRQEKYQPAEMTCHVNDTFQVTHPVRIKARGIYRRDECTMPPFWLNIRYSGIEAELLSDVKKMKMVIRCRSATQYDSYVLREYLVYRIYNLISPYSFRVRLVKLKIVNTGKDNKVSEDWAFLIEPQEVMANRLDGRMIKSDMLSMRTVNREIMSRVALFQYMVGNGDYSVTGRHNLKILVLKAGQPSGFIPVPYDFDYTGLVNTHYAIPGESLGIKSVRERYFMGPCRSKDFQQRTIQEFAQYQEEIVDLIMDFEYLDDREKEDMVNYILSYFAESERENFFERSIASTCRQ